MAEWKSGILQFESHILCGPMQLSLVVVISRGGVSVKGGLALCVGDSAFLAEVGFNYLVPEYRSLPEVMLPVRAV
jgi:hypothetical protein